MDHNQKQCARQRATQMLSDAGIVILPEMLDNMEIVDFGLGDLGREGLEIVTYVNNDRYCAKELIMFPGQTCPEHRHPDGAGYRGKRETFFVRFGKVILCVPGEPAKNPQATPPGAPAGAYTVFHEIPLRAGEQYTIEADTPHWFQATVLGAIVSEFSSTSRDESDIFSDQRVKRIG
jgi:D-lyxose ketol-isomerase